MTQRRILSLWFPRLDAERLIRAETHLAELPFAVATDVRGALVLSSLSAAAEAVGLRRGMGLGDARAIHPDLATRPVDPPRLAAFLTALRRWAGRFSPWVAEEAPESLALDVSGCARLFGGEEALVARLESDAVALGLSLRFGLADTLGAAWAVARFAGAQTGVAGYAGDAIDQEARATRSRAQKRRWERGGAAPLVAADQQVNGRNIIPPGETRAHLAPLPVAGLRLAPEEIEALNTLGLRRIGDLTGLPRAQLVRRVGSNVARRLDEALGATPEPVSPARPAPVFALRLTLPEPIGLEADVLAGIDRLLPPLCDRLRAAGMGARRVRLSLMKAEGGAEIREVGLARPADQPETIRGLLALRLGEIDAGFGIETMRLEAVAVEPRSERQHRGQLEAGRSVAARHGGDAAQSEEFADLLGRLGARLGLEALVRLHPADSHIPEKTAIVVPAAFTEPVMDWPAPPAPRPIRLFPPEAVKPREGGTPPKTFVWRRKERRLAAAVGPERIAPEWWLDDPAWRSGARDYWRVETTDGDRIWIFEAKGGVTSAGWFAHGVFA